MDIEKIVVMLTDSTDTVILYAKNLKVIPFPSDWNIADVMFKAECPKNMGVSWVTSNEAFNGIPLEIMDIR